ncbi:MAG: FtsX-like permease family protein [Lachnospiraceae bacterium]|nr:FtsX-like permease family protein [Lachnospiraceae bacterium]
MDNYRKLAIRYLNMNKRRSAIAIFGVIVTTVILFTFLNVMCGLLENERKREREEEDYEMVFFLQSEEQGEQILSDRRVKSAYIGPYYEWSYNTQNEELVHANTLYVNVTQPYRINAIFNDICQNYGVEGEINEYLANLYFQGTDEEGMVAAALFVLLVAYIFAIFGVGIVRNAIQLCALENIRDYGNLRCIGASKGQLKSIIYFQGAILELIGIGIGVVLGTIVSYIVGAVFHMEIGFHLIGVILILIVFMGDLYFTMGENSKLITGMSPLSAIRGEYRIKKEKIKLREHNLFGKIFGVDGDYAYKSLMRNRKRFFRTVAAMVFGIAMFIGIAGAVHSINEIIKEKLAEYRYYQIYFEHRLGPGKSIEEVQATLPSAKQLERLTQLEEVTEAKRIYSCDIWLADTEDYYQHYTEEFLTTTYGGDAMARIHEAYQSASEIEGKARRLDALAAIECYGYDETDYARYESALVEGTLDISDHGIVIVNQGKMEKAEELTETLGIEYVQVAITDYHVGDTIQIVNMERFGDMVQTEWERLDKEAEEREEQLRKELAGNEQEFNQQVEELEKEIYLEKKIARYNCWQELISQGDYETYTIEGIVNADVNRSGSYFRIILPLEQYFAMTGTDETMNTGMQFHFDKIPMDKNLSVICNEILWGDMDINSEIEYNGLDYSEYVWMIDELMNMKKVIFFVLLIVIFVVLMASLNFINATASNLHLRRREFAQLRVIGTSKERLVKMVLLEGVITTVIANILGILLGTGLCIYVFYFVNLINKLEFHFPWLASLGCIIGSFLLLCGAIYVPMRKLSQSMVEDLTTGGD